MSDERKILTDKEKIELLEKRIGELFEFFKWFEGNLNNFRKGGKLMEYKGQGGLCFEEVEC